MRKFLLVLLLPFASSIGLADGGTLTGNPGDPLRFHFKLGQESAREMVSTFRTEELTPDLREDLRQWLINHRRELADVIGATHLEWEPASTSSFDSCALAGWDDERRPVVYLWYERCRPNVGRPADATTLLIHEALHHLGLVDEADCDAIALAVADAWRRSVFPAADGWLIDVQAVDAPHGRVHAPGVTIGGRVWLWGGGAAGALQADGGVYDPVTRDWTLIPHDDQLTARAGHSLVTAGNTVVAWGGRQAHLSIPLNDGAVFHLDDHQWTPMHGVGVVARGEHSAVVWDGSMYVWGGFDDRGGPLDDGFVVNLSTGVTRQLSHEGAPSKRGRHRAFLWRDKMYVVGGYDKFIAAASRPDHFLYDLQTDTWAPLESAGAPPSLYKQAAAWTGSFMVVAGHSRTTAHMDVLAAYDPETDAWSPLTVDPTVNVSIAAKRRLLAVGDKLMLLAAEPSRSSTIAVWELDPATGRWTAMPSLDFGAQVRDFDALWTGREVAVWATLSGSTPMATAVLSRRASR